MNSLFQNLPHVAYIDGGSGSMILQVALAGVFASLYAIKGFWGRLKGLATRSNREDVKAHQ